MILTHKCLLVDIFLTRRLSKSLAFCKFASVNFEPWHKNNTDSIFFLSSLLLSHNRHEDNLINTFYSFSFSVMHLI